MESNKLSSYIYSLHPSKLRRCWLRCLVRDPLGMLKRFCSGGFGSILIEISSLLRVSTNQKQSGLAFSGRRSMSIPTWNGWRLCNQISDSISNYQKCVSRWNMVTVPSHRLDHCLRPDQRDIHRKEHLSTNESLACQSVLHPLSSIIAKSIS